MTQIYGLIGGIGSGKSEVARIFENLGAVVLDADKIGHEVLFLNSVKKIVERRWGKSVFDSSGEIDRRQLAAIVFEQTEKGAEELRFLTDTVHPLIAHEFERRIRIARNKCERVVILDAPLLFEAKWRHLVSKVIFVDAPESVRLDRVRKRGWTQDEFRNRESTQWSVDRKKNVADIVISNAESLEELVKKVEKIFHTEVL